MTDIISPASTSTDWGLNRDKIIRSALRKCGIVQQGKAPTPAQRAGAVEALNALVKSWQSRDVFLWTVEWEPKVLSASDEVTGTDGKVYMCTRGHTSADNNRPITGSRWPIYWYQRGSTGGTWLVSTDYASIGDFALDDDTLSIQGAFLRDSNGADHLVEIISFEEYLGISSKFTEGITNRMAVDWELTPQAYLYPQLNDTSYILHMQRVQNVADFDLPGDGPDFPVRWTQALIWGLAEDLAYEYGLPRDQRIDFERKAEKYFLEAKASGREPIESSFVDPCY